MELLPHTHTQRVKSRQNSASKTKAFSRAFEKILILSHPKICIYFDSSLCACLPMPSACYYKSSNLIYLSITYYCPTRYLELDLTQIGITNFNLLRTWNGEIHTQLNPGLPTKTQPRTLSNPFKKPEIWTYMARKRVD